ncbi:MAG: thiamine phosphate synthase [Bacteroidales bacterium]|jgi:thiamine-phosphate pyrophosphorylase|nr:thiamine phosphate synthase [Bacteroidales bacterium]
MHGLIFITQESEKYSHVESAELALRGGCRLIQLRMKNTPLAEIEDTARVLKTLCDTYNAYLFIDDHVEICKSVNAAGVHVGKNDMPPADARKVLGETFIIGGTANTFDDIVNLYRAGVNYIGLGPFRFTETKKNLSPLLGLEGYAKKLQQSKEQSIVLPIFAIGGIVQSDIPALMRTGVAGIALSGAIVQAHNPVEKTQQIIHEINRWNGK